MTIPTILRVNSTFASGSSITPAVAVDTTGRYMGMLIVWWVWNQGAQTVSSPTYNSEAGVVLGNDIDSNGNDRLTHGYVVVPPEKGANVNLQVTLSGSTNWWIAYHLLRNVDAGFPTWDHFIQFNNPAMLSRRLYVPPGGMLVSAIQDLFNDYQVTDGLTLVNNVTAGGRMTGEEPAADDGDRGWALGGWTHTGTGRRGTVSTITFRPMQSSLPRRQLYYRRDRAMAGLPVSQEVPI